MIAILGMVSCEKNNLDWLDILWMEINFPKENNMVGFQGNSYRKKIKKKLKNRWISLTLPRYMVDRNSQDDIRKNTLINPILKLKNLDELIDSIYMEWASSEISDNDRFFKDICN